MVGILLLLGKREWYRGVKGRGGGADKREDGIFLHCNVVEKERKQREKEELPIHLPPCP